MAKVIDCNGCLVIEASAREMYVAVGSPGICDYCGEPSSKGYYIAVLNKWFCPDCYEKWKERVTPLYNYEKVIEQRNFDYYADLLGVICQ